MSILSIFGIAGLLRIGLSIDSVQTEQVQMQGFHLLWKDKLHLTINSVTISETSGDSTPTIPSITTITRFCNLFSRVIIENIQYGEYTGKLHFVDHEDEISWFHLDSEDLHLNSDITFETDGFVLSITEFRTTQYKTEATGEIRVDLKNINATGELTAQITQHLPLALAFTADKKTFEFYARDNGEISDVAPVIELFELDQDIEPWITKRLKAKRFRLNSLSGNFPWNKPEQVLNTLIAEAEADSVAYTFEDGIAPVEAEHAVVTFQEGILTIKPHNTRFHNQDCETSWLDFDFNNPDAIILNIYLTAKKPVLDKNILKLLKAYDIELPFYQVKGVTDTNLTLTINLNDETVTAKGLFKTGKSVFDLGGQQFNITDGVVTLDDSKATIEKLDVAIKNYIKANITGQINGEEETGKLEITVQEMNFQLDGLKIQVQPKGPRPVITYSINPKGDKYKVSPTAVMAGEMEFLISPFGGSWDANSYTAQIPPTLIVSPQGVQATLSGSVSLQSLETNLLCELSQYNRDNIKLREPQKLPVQISYKNELVIQSKTPSTWLHDTTPITLAPTLVSSGENYTRLKTDSVKYGENFSGGLQLLYHRTKQDGKILIERSNIFGQQLGTFEGTLSTKEQKSREYSFPELGVIFLTFLGKEKGWRVDIQDLSKLYGRSDLLQKIELESGGLQIISSPEDRSYTFSALLPYKRPILMTGKNKKPVDQYTVVGKWKDNAFTARVNKSIMVSYTDGKSTLTADSLVINVPEIIDLLLEHSNDEQEVQQEKKEEKKEEKESFQLTIHAGKNSALYFSPSNTALADSLDFTYEDDKTSLNLVHGPGTITMNSDGDSFSLYGSKLNDIFMGSLFENSTFKGGRMNLVGVGTFDNFTALVRIKDTLLKDHQGFNNIMGVLNTVPALVTFSAPEYNTKGIEIDSLVAGASVKDGKATFESLELHSPLFDITGSGWADFLKQQVDMDINLTTRAKKNIQKIPIIGYIVAGEEKHPSITLEVKGNLTDPKVETPIFREVSTMPFSMLFRTLKLPIELMEQIAD